MKILALIKYSLEVSEIKVDPKSHALQMAGVPSKIGNIDKNVVELAVRLKEANEGTVMGLCYGPAGAADSFKDVLAMGMDEATLVVEPEGAAHDSAITAKILRAAIEKMGEFDLIVAGFASDDGFSYQMAPRLAEKLGLPLVSYVSSVSVADGKITAERDLDDALQVVSCATPAIVSVAEEAFTPRKTTLMDAIKAKKKPVTTWQVEADLGLTIDTIAGESKYVSSEAKGVVVNRKQNIFKEIPVEEMADKLIDALIHENILKEG